jgi:transcription-repair coupling factor (superfamily II helicase)
VSRPIDLISLAARHPGVGELARAVETHRRAVVSGIGGSAVNLAAGHILRSTKRPVVIIVAHIDDADEALDELSSVPAFALPALEALPGETGVSAELFAERLSAIRAVTNLATPSVIIAPIAALMQLVPPPAQLEHLARTLRTGQDIKLAALTNWLVSAGYKRVEAVEEVGDFALRGGIVDIFPPGSANARTDRETSQGTPVRLDFFGDTLDRITEIDIESMNYKKCLVSTQK